MILYWIAFSLYFAGHLAACYLEKMRLRAITKVFLVPLLMLGVFLTGAHYPLLYFGLFFGWLGDIFLIFKGKRCFYAGALCFITGHFCYIAATLQLFLRSHNLADVPLLLWLIFAVVALGLLLSAMLWLRRLVGRIAYLGAAYFSTLFAALLLSIAAGNTLLAVAFGVFILSDVILSASRFFVKIPRDHFYIMSTYIAAQLLICISFIRL